MLFSVTKLEYLDTCNATKRLIISMRENLKMIKVTLKLEKRFQERARLQSSTSLLQYHVLMSIKLAYVF